MIRVSLPYHLRNMAKVADEVEVEVEGEVTLSAVLDSLEKQYPMLKGTIRDQVTKKRRPFLRFFACEEDLHRPFRVVEDARQPLAIFEDQRGTFVRREASRETDCQRVRRQRRPCSS